MTRAVLRRTLLVLACLLPFPLVGCGSNGPAGKATDGGTSDGGGTDGGGTGVDDGGAGAGGTGGVDASAGSSGSGGAAGASGGNGGSGGGGGLAGTDGGADSGTDGAPDAAVDMVIFQDVGASDTNIPPNPPTNLSAVVQDRRATSFRLSWTAPATTAGGRVTGYDVRAALLPITSSNFDDTSVSKVVPYAGAGAPVGQPDGVVASGLYIENGYYFAVAALDGVGNRSSIVATSAAVTAHFNVTSLTGTSGLANEEAGFSLDGSGDANNDGVSDILAGAFNSGLVYIFMGSSSFPAAAPSVTITGTTTSFGRGVGYVGDIDGDLKEDIAIGDPVRNEVFIYKGRTTWPTALAESDADYVISTDSTYSGSQFGQTISRLGDFNGDGVDDFVVTASNRPVGAATLIGRVTIILGSATFSNLPLPNTSRAIIIDGDTTMTRPVFGTRAVGLGHFYSGAGATLVVSASGVTASGIASNNEGHIYAFRGQSGTAGVIDISSADAVIAGVSAPERIGVALANLGPILGPLPSLGSGNLGDTVTVPGISGSTFVFSGDTTLGPFESKDEFYDTSDGNTGVAVMGGGISGRDISYSLVGTSTPDLVILGKTASFINIIDGSTLGGFTNPFNVANGAPSVINVPVPIGWDFTAPVVTIVPDINHDLYPDFVISDSVTAVPGKVAVFW